MLEEKAAEERREYLRRWRRKNPDKTRKHCETYWKKRAENRKNMEKLSDDKNRK